MILYHESKQKPRCTQTMAKLAVEYRVLEMAFRQNVEHNKSVRSIQHAGRLSYTCCSSNFIVVSTCCWLAISIARSFPG